MSYAFTVPLRGLGITIPANVSASASVNVKPAEVVKVAEEAGVVLPDCSAAAITGNSYIDSTLVNCCKDVKKMSNMTTKEKAVGIGKCIARGAATGACMAAGVVTFGVTTVLAPLCGTIGAAIYDRIAGWDTKQWIAAGVGGGICAFVTVGVGAPICAFAAAELVGWISDKLGPVIDGIFNPSAAKDRELAARKAFHSLVDTREEFTLQANQSLQDLWSNSISSIKQMYTGTIGLLPAAYQTKAQQILGFLPRYDGIAKALVSAGAPMTPLDWPIDSAGKTIADRVRTQYKNAGYGCEGSAAGCMKDGYSEVCPFSFSDMYMALWFGQGMDKLKGNTRDKQVAFEKKALSALRAEADELLPKMQQAIAVVSTKVATVVMGLKHQALLEEAKVKNEAMLVGSALAAANSAENAASTAKSWSSYTRTEGLLRAQAQYEIATRARAVMTFAATPGSVPASATNIARMNAAVARAAAAVKSSQSNAQMAQVMIGGSVAVGVAGIGYLLLRRT